MPSYRSLSVIDTGVLVRAGAGHVSFLDAFNTSNALRFLKLYDKATAPASTDTPIQTIPIPAGGRAATALAGLISFSLGLGIRCTTGAADNDTGAPTANDVLLTLVYA